MRKTTGQEIAISDNPSPINASINKSKDWQSLEFGRMRKAKQEKKILGQRATTDGKQRHMAILSFIAHGR